MEKLIRKHNSLCDGLKTLDIACAMYQKLLNKNAEATADDLVVMDMARDSLIQRFEYCTEMFWKYLALYLEKKHSIIPEILSPLVVIRTACAAHILSPEQAEKTISMVRDRNQTSHMYKQEIADRLAQLIPGYYQHMRSIVDSL